MKKIITLIASYAVIGATNAYAATPAIVSNLIDGCCAIGAACCGTGVCC